MDNIVDLKENPVNIADFVAVQRDYYYTDITKPYEFRVQALERMQEWIVLNESTIFDALQQDLGKGDFESYITEVGITREEVRYAIRHLKSWMKPKKQRTPLSHFPSKSKIYAQPYGVVLIMSAWNYPFHLTINPLIGAIAAGNCCVVKPSNYAPATATVIAQMVRECFEPGHVHVILGGREQNQDLLKQKFDYIFFTGGIEVGKKVLESATKNVTPVTLELGGKCPCIVDETADLQLAARRIIFGKYINAGQTCVAPDYLYVHESKKDELVRRMIDSIHEFYTDDALGNPEYPRIVNQKHFDRLTGLMEGEHILYGGKSNPETLKIMPTLLDVKGWATPVMRDEIFGPLFPILTYQNIDELRDTLIARPRPLALYLFSKSKQRQQDVIRSIPYGGGCINDTIVHLATPRLPFGGIGDSGMGSYHGRYSFNTFTSYKSILSKANWLDLSARYLPGTFKKLNFIRKLMH